MQKSVAGDSQARDGIGVGVYNPDTLPEEEIGVTVCVAAIGWGGDTVIGASDRMITSRDVQFEPEQSKTWQLTSSMVAMIADDAYVQTEIYSIVKPKVTAQIAANPQEWVSVGQVAHWWAEAYAEIKAREAENAVLRPLMLDRDTFYSKQHEMDGDFISSVGNQLLTYDRMANAATIITGVDETGPHVYIVQNEHSSPADRIGFASIGIGARHANSQLMFRGHTPQKDLPETLLAVYMAKRRADEVSPGVGQVTDMFGIGPQPGTYSPIATGIVERLQKEYEQLREDENRATTKAEEGMKGYVEEIFRQRAEETARAEQEAKAKQAAIPEGPENGAATVDEGGIRTDAAPDEPEVEH